MLALLLVGFILAPLRLLLPFWNMFPQDRWDTAVAPADSPPTVM